SFFLSSRRRHTSSKRDWSSDVCSSDLDRVARNADRVEPFPAEQEPDDVDDTAEQAHLDADDHQERAVALEARGLRGVGPDELDETEHQVALEVDEERHVQRARGGHESPIRVRDAAEEQGRWPGSV